MTSLLVFLLIATGLVCIDPAAAAVSLRGLAPEQLDKYKSNNGKWKCLLSGHEILFSQINDNFCDCPDSSDEPGTSACPHGIFYCLNKGHKEKYLTSAFVDDGVCDCCDGTDELSGCTNTCLQKNAVVREGLQQKIEEYKLSLQKKQDVLDGAAKKKSHILSRLGSIDKDIADKTVQIEQWAVEQKQLEEDTAKEREEQRKKREEEAAAKAAKAAEEAAAAPPSEEAVQTPPAEQATPHEETDEERGRRIASQWTKDPEAAGVAAEGATPETVTKSVDGEEEEGWMGKAWKKLGSFVGSGSDTASEEDSAKDQDQQAETPDEERKRLQEEEEVRRMEEEAALEAEAAAPEEEQPPDESWQDEGAEPEVPDQDSGEPKGSEAEAGAPPAEETAEQRLREVRRKHTGAKADLERLQKEKEKLQVQQAYLDDKWLGLADTCVEAREPQYTYRGCIFEKAAQVDNGAGHETNLGRWKGFSPDMTKVIFDNGDFCANAPQRSFTLSLKCGKDTRAWGASEPSTCVYTAEMESPIACNESGLKELETELEKLLELEAAVAKEIEEDERIRAAELAKLRKQQDAAGLHDEL